MSGAVPLSALLSQAWIAFTIEVDNAFEARMPHRTTRGGRTGSHPWLVSHPMWWNAMRHVDAAGLTLAELEARTGLRTNLPGMLRWGYVTIDPSAPRRTAVPPPGSVVRATAQGERAREVWAPLPAEIEARWRGRIGPAAFAALKAVAERIAAQLDSELPDCLPILGHGLTVSERMRPFQGVHDLSLQPLLARALLWLTRDFELEANLSLAVGANLLRLLDENATSARTLPAMAGVSREAVAAMAASCARRGWMESWTTGGVRQMRLTQAGLAANALYRRTILESEQRWRACVGADLADALRAGLQRVVTGESGKAFLAEAVAPPPSGWRGRSPSSALPWQPMVLHRGGFPDGA